MCFNPKFAYYDYEYSKTPSQKQATFKKKLIFIKKDEKELKTLQKNVLTIPCGQCLACRIDQAKNWATRCYLEAKKYEYNQFLTLTIDEKHNDKSLHKEDLQKFLKRLRKKLYKNGEKIRYYACGEYGSINMRPHYHLLVFNLKPFRDQILWGKSKSGHNIYKSDILNEIWGKGFTYIEPMTFETAAYAARYSQKKINRDYDKFCDELMIQREFQIMSRKPGLALDIINSPKFETIKQQFGILVNTENGAKIQNIPQAIRKKWREQDKIEYFELSDKNTEKNKELMKEKLNQTNLTPREYRIMIAKQTEKRLKRLPRENL